MAPIAPPIEGDLWFNTDPITSEHLRGRVVVLVFWSAGCEASLHRLQQVGSLLDKGLDRSGLGCSDLVAVAVHTPRMACEDDVERLRHAVRRHRIAMPVVHDPHYRTWSRFEPPGWPSTAVIDRRGRITGIAAGCRDFDVIETAVGDAISQPVGRRSDDPEPPVLPTRAEPAERWPEGERSIDLDGARLRYPAGLAAIARRASTRLAVTDRDRLIVGRAGPDLRNLRVDLVLEGVDQPGTVAFTDPVTVVVVERGTNTVSSIDVSTGERSIITADLVRPVGITVDMDGSLVITDAADDRLYRATANSDRSGHLVLPIAGSGRTGVRSGRADDAELAQPVAAVRTGAGLVFADAASSNLRLLTDVGEVINITDSDLFDWGLLDGPAHRARLQRPTALGAFADGSIVVVDSGNNRLRLLHHRRIETVGLDGLSAPTAVAVIDENRILVADTDNHRLIAVDPIRQDAWPVIIDGLDETRPITVWDAETGTSVDQLDHVSSGSATSAT
ncbi:MAG: redoxin domain-containing protein [Acidimicrobiia bacterium]|nr:redoxin domain-containing protein [Acidimicrobiia bacterium]